jgi:predicted DNA-binding transcriptional regulator AlpA
MTFIGGPAATWIVSRESAQAGLMTMPAVCARLSVVLGRHVSRRELYRIRKADPTFPAPVDFGYARAVIYRAQHIHDWCKARSAERSLT